MTTSPSTVDATRYRGATLIDSTCRLLGTVIVAADDRIEVADGQFPIFGFLGPPADRGQKANGRSA
jgi:hypothetical protein